MLWEIESSEFVVQLSPDRWPAVVGQRAGRGFSLSAPGRLCSKAPPGLGPETSWTLAGRAHSGAPTKQFDKLRGFSVKMDARLSSGLGPLRTE